MGSRARTRTCSRHSIPGPALPHPPPGASFLVERSGEESKLDIRMDPHSPPSSFLWASLGRRFSTGLGLGWGAPLFCPPGTRGGV